MKDLNISKELIKNVLVEETENLSDDFTFNIKDNYILFADDGECQFEVNIYEFAFKCKEWANERGYTITSNFQVALINYNYEINITRPIKVIFYKKDEIEAIIESCEWILEQEK